MADLQDQNFLFSSLCVSKDILATFYRVHETFARQKIAKHMDVTRRELCWTIRRRWKEVANVRRNLSSRMLAGQPL